jgi:hypothetical protein
MNTNQEYETKSVQFSSSNRTSGSLSNPSFLLREQIHNIVGVKLKSAMIPLSFYTFDTHNNKIYLVEDTDPVVECTISPGLYTSSTISSAIKTALEAGGAGTYTISYSATTNKINIQCATQFKFLDGVNNAYYEMGITSSDLNSFSTNFTPSQVIDLSGPKIIHLVSNIGATKVVGKNYNVLASVICEEDALSISSFEDFSNDYVGVRFSTLSDLQLNLYDEFFRVITPYRDYSITINFLTQ